MRSAGILAIGGKRRRLKWLKTSSVAIGESRKLVCRVKLAADVSGQQGDIEGLEQLHQWAQLAHQLLRPGGFVANNVHHCLIVLPQSHHAAAEVVLIHSNSVPHCDELLQGDVPLHRLFQGPPAVESLARTSWEERTSL
jgi:hypothetical protein